MAVRLSEVHREIVNAHILRIWSFPSPFAKNLLTSAMKPLALNLPPFPSL